MDEAISTRVPADVKRAAEAEAKRAGMNISTWLRYQLRKLTDTEPRALSEMEGPSRDRAAAA
jgi:antitoxin component of RelBE/YafQ-DinJ toxin-antitoxin module